MNRQRVAITGAGGKVGAALVARLAARGDCDVVAIVRNALSRQLLGSVDAEIRIGSVADAAASRGLLADCDAIVNCALATGWPAAARRQNEAIVRNIAAAPRVRVAVHFSTVAVYGTCVDPRRNSFARPRPDTPYGLDKLRLERFARKAFSARGIHHYIVRLGHVYGHSQWVSRDVLERSGEASFALPFGGKIASNAVSIEAVVAAVESMLAQEQASGVRNLVDSPQSSWRELYDFHTGLMDRPPVASVPEIASLEIRHRYYAAARRPLLTIARGLRNAFGPADPVKLAQLEAFRLLVHDPLMLLPAPLVGLAGRVYLRRKVRQALGQTSAAQGLATGLGLLCAPEVPGPCYETIDARLAAARMQDELLAWLRGLSSYRWDPAAFGLAALQEAPAQPVLVAAAGR